MSSPRAISERAVVFLIGAVQFVNILDFVMVMPLGPDFAAGLGIATSDIGTIGAAYTAAASVAGVVGSYFLDRFDRRKALAVAMLGLVASTAAGGLATGKQSLLLARAMAGLFGGPATSLSLSIIADLIPVERRGRAMGSVMGAFSVASVVGIPMALKVANWADWRMPFFLVAGMGLLLVAGAIFFLPPMRGHLERKQAHVVSVRELFTRADVLLSYSMTGLLNVAGFVIIPNISAYVQHNLGYPRDELETIYFVGGLVSFVTFRLAGTGVDRLGSFRVGTLGSVMFVTTIYFIFIRLPAGVPLVAIFSFFFLSNGVRNVAYSTLASRVPEQAIRARFMSFQSAVQHLGAAAGAFLSSQLLSDLPGGQLGGIHRVVLVSMCFSLIAPVTFFLVERRVLARDRALAASGAVGAPVALGTGGGTPRS
ncbi:MFS transporter [Vitiosangium sp. GDMCC 1.1324]|uniref:MFS transporter n=1 Tax=Vitiosangium sp. (strain GDMCC 1.1324) TaxID=2138576 RepID=UPI000D35F721|nr:MFS transporter [Vitiosangium sp. GDMCC 1.1324]PTL83798.1 MFS transporter [Vitiosangium sp. GDMCC 1.1324]